MPNSRLTCVVLGACAVASQAEPLKIQSPYRGNDIQLWGLPWLSGGSSDATTTTPQERYDCSTSSKDWSKNHREYCCSRHSLGCNEHDHVIDCVAGFASWRTSWSEDKQEECCRRFGRACPDEGISTPRAPSPSKDQDHFDCDASLSDFKASWSDQKINWCCEHKKKGCWEDGVSANPADHKASFKCLEDASDWKRAWSDGKKAWCCTHHNLGCAEGHSATTSKAPTTSSSSSSSSSSSLSSSSSPTTSGSSWASSGADESVGTTSLPFDCTQNMATWEDSWSQGKKAWCCVHEQIGCPRHYDCNEGSHDTWTRWKREACRPTTTTHVTTTELEIYDCDVGFEHWMTMWTQEKKHWCCRHHERGCPDSAPIDDGTQYDCQANFEHWLTLWMPSKRAWCCDHEPSLAAHAMCFVSEDKYDAKGLKAGPTPARSAAPVVQSVFPGLFWLASAAILVGLVIRQMRQGGTQRGTLRLFSRGTDEEMGLQVHLPVE